MKLELRSFQSKVARRIFILFIVCAILPVSAVALISFGQVERQLRKQSEARLQRECKAMGVSVYERLLFLRAEIRAVAAKLQFEETKAFRAQRELFGKEQMDRFSGLALVSTSRTTHLWGKKFSPPRLSPDQRAHLYSGSALLDHRFASSGIPFFYISVTLDPDDPDKGILCGEINAPYLWEAAERMPPNVGMCVLDASRKILFSSLGDPQAFPAIRFKSLAEGLAGEFNWRLENEPYVGRYSSIFMKPNFFYPEWVVVLSESEADIASPMSGFKLSFPLLIVMTLGMVFFLSISQIRRSMGPIERLREATRWIARGSFGRKVSIKSNDEFESLGNAFNEMSQKLQETQDLLVRSAKLSTMGQMAAGVMHEIKQPLSAIHGLLQLSAMEDDEIEREKNLKTAFEAVNRLNGILERFRSFSHAAEETLEHFSINTVVKQIHSLLEHQMVIKKIHCSLETAPDLPLVLGDGERLQQVFSNLVMNAIQALETKEDGERRLVIKTYSEGDSVFAEVQDNGPGIPQEVQDRIFDPFFTTKDPEKGTGLGMAIVQSILHRIQANISFKSEVGMGTTFLITFPASTGKETS
jgi:signal transduction histidine kinase